MNIQEMVVKIGSTMMQIYKLKDLSIPLKVYLNMVILLKKNQILLSDLKKQYLVT